jgi:hypothetical protein
VDNLRSTGQVLHYIDTQQKITSRLEEPWPTFAGAHKVLPPVASVLNDAHMLVLRAIWLELIVPMGLGTDSIAYRDDVVALLEREFKRRTGLSVPGMLLAAAAETERKRGDWLRLRDYPDGDVGFNDLDQIG